MNRQRQASLTTVAAFPVPCEREGGLDYEIDARRTLHDFPTVLTGLDCHVPARFHIPCSMQERRTDRRTDRQTDRQTDRWTVCLRALGGNGLD